MGLDEIKTLYVRGEKARKEVLQAEHNDKQEALDIAHSALRDAKKNTCLWFVAILIGIATLVISIVALNK